MWNDVATKDIKIGDVMWDYNLRVSIILSPPDDRGWFDTTGGLFDASRLARRNPYDFTLPVPTEDTVARAREVLGADYTPDR